MRPGAPLKKGPITACAQIERLSKQVIHAYGRVNMLKQSLILGALAAALVTPASSQISIYIGIAPPPIRIEAPPPPPAPSFVWVPGFWAPQGHHYRWIAGHYMQPPYAEASWIVPHYEHGPQGWRYREGYWGRPGHGHGHAYGHDHAWKDDHYHGHKEWKGDEDDHGNGHHHRD